MNGAEGVNIFHLRAGAVLSSAHRHHRHIYIRPQRTLLHFAVRHTAELQDGPQLFHILYRLIGAGNIRLRHNFQQRHAAAIVVHQRAVAPLIVHQLAGVLLHVDLLDPHFLGAAVDLVRDLHIAILTNGQIQLANLVCFGQIGIKIILTVKFIVPGDGAVGSQTGTHRVFHHTLIHHRQCARHTGANLTNMAVRFAAKRRRAVAKDLGLGGEFRMDLQTANGIVFHYSASFSVTGDCL